MVSRRDSNSDKAYLFIYALSTTIRDSATIKIWAGDTNTCFTNMAFQHMQTRATQYLRFISQWPHIIKLQLILSEANYVMLTPINKPLNYTIDLIYRNNALKQSKAQKYLGV